MAARPGSPKQYRDLHRGGTFTRGVRHAVPGLAGDGVRGAFDDPEARQMLATIILSLAGLVAFA